MKILLIKPFIKYEERGNEFPPLGLAYIAAILEKNGHNVKILDRLTLRQSEEEFEEYLKKMQPDIVGLTCMTPEYASAINNLQILKKILPESTIIFGGIHPTLFPEEMLRKHKEIDYIVIGEGEKTIVELVSFLETKNVKIETIKSIAYRDTNGNIVRNSPRELIEDLDKLPLPAHHLLDLDKYHFSQLKFENKKYMMIITSRGCPFKCTFCARPVFGRNVRYRSISTVLKEIDELIHKFGITSFSFVDDTFTLDSKRVLQLCDELIKRDYNLTWSCMTNLHTIDEQVLIKMKQAGCIRVSYGVESADPAVLDKINKSRESGLVEKVFELTHRAGIETLAFFMVGLPGETPTTTKLNRQLIKKIKPDYIQATVLCPLPGSEIYENNKDKLPTEWEKYQMAITKEKPLIQLGYLKYDEQIKEVKKIYRSFYLSPVFIIRRLKRDIRSIKDLLFFIKKGLIMIKLWF